MFQGFEWYCPPDHQHWTRLARAIPSLAALGVTSMWIPPAGKAATPYTNGYDTYDMFDLGEFDQKGTVPTKWGSKQDLLSMMKVAERNRIGILFDCIMNHKAAADATECVSARKVDPQGQFLCAHACCPGVAQLMDTMSSDRRIFVGEVEEIEAWTQFNFDGRSTNHSKMKWDKGHFNGIDWDHKSKTRAIWKFEGKNWARDVSQERGNFDYLQVSFFCVLGQVGTPPC